MFGRSRPPAEVRALLEVDERPLSWATTESGAVVLATNLGLWWPFTEPRRIPWHLLDLVVWSEAGFAVTEAEVVDDLLLVERPAVRVALAEPRKLPAVVKKRVEANIVRTTEVQLSDGSAWIVGRKVAGQDGLSWWARLRPGTPDSALVRDELLDIIEPLREESTARLAELESGGL
jgi:hypothetical protein